MELDRAEAIVKELLAPKYLNPPQELVFRAAWQGQSYRQLAETAGYDRTYIKSVGAQLWRMLSIATQSKVSKVNFRQVIESVAAQRDLRSAAEPRSPQSGIDWGEAMDISTFYGRELERSQLERWIVRDRCRLVAILGMGGMGKTTIAVELVQQLQAQIQRGMDDPTVPPTADRFDCILWRSLLNAPPLQELLPELIRMVTLAPGLAASQHQVAVPLAECHDLRQIQLAIVPKTVAGQIELLLEICQQYRCLIVLDNAESILQAGAQVGQYRSGYADYGDLFSTLGRTNHQSCLLLTSREKPTEISQLEGINAKVRTFILPGLDAVAGQRIFADRGCAPISPTEWVEIDRYCGGNPLAFQLIAAAVQEVADGDVSEIFPYLRSSNLGFADIQILLEQQWERLTSEEQQVMYWLAIGREPLSISDLAGSLHPAWNRQGNYPAAQPISRHTSLLTVLQSLRRRSIIANLPGIDRTQRHWSLQPMVMEYVTGRLVDRICTEIERQRPFLLDTHPIAQATAKEYLRQAQLRTIVRPAIDRLRTSIGNPQHIGIRLRQTLAYWRVTHALQPGYLAGNILNLLTHLKLDLTDLDCSELYIWQAYLVGANLVRVNFANAQMQDCAFTQTFSSILAIAYSPEGQTLAASDSNGEIRLWSVQDGQCLLTCSGHTNWVRSIAFSPDGRYLASSSDDRTIKLWDLQDGTCVQTLGDGIHSLGLSFSPDGSYLASGSTDNRIYYWHLPTGVCERQFAGHQHWSMDVCFHPHGHKLVSGGADGTIRIWDVATGNCDIVWQGHENWVTTIDYSGDGTTILSGSLDGNLRLWDATEPSDRAACRLTISEHGDEIWSAVFSPDGSQIASAGVGGLLRIWRASDGFCLHNLEGHSDRLWAVAFHPQGYQIASGGEDRTLRVWQVSDGKCLQAFNGYTNWFRAIAWSPDGHRLLTASRDAQIRVWCAIEKICLHQLTGHTKSTNTVAADPQGRTFASGSDDRTIRIWDAQTLACTQILHGHPGEILALVYSPDGKYLISGGSDRTIRIWDTQSWRCLQVLVGHTDRIGSLAYHPTRDLIASASEDLTVRLWNLHDNAPLEILTHTNRAIALAFDPGGTILASGGMDSKILLWNIDTGQLCHEFNGHTGWILSLAYSPDGKWLFSGASDSTIEVWSMDTGLCTDTYTGHQGWVWSVAVSGCGQFVASASEDETVRFWNLADGRILSTCRAHRPYEGMNIAGVEGLTKAQMNTLKTLGAWDGVSL
ncbi:pentapeptide repeat-containing protein [Chamaesiphon sp. VAR_69_metabat_338]|uniref:WD40 domain-containing protein n=1 Tax=Chamaesiphon sp. VAR_69_metabat_338 TaxID=2964704 RepID=UPI00286DA5BD|nr:pentapeptide repeat-containing protein [Chamaesiphon sp. VAR_69_metabat_338]